MPLQGKSTSNHQTHDNPPPGSILKSSKKSDLAALRSGEVDVERKLAIPDKMQTDSRDPSRKGIYGVLVRGIQYTNHPNRTRLVLDDYNALGTGNW